MHVAFKVSRLKVKVKCHRYLVASRGITTYISTKLWAYHFLINSFFGVFRTDRDTETDTDRLTHRRKDAAETIPASTIKTELYVAERIVLPMYRIQMLYVILRHLYAFCSADSVVIDILVF